MENESAGIAEDRGLAKRGDFLSWWYFRRLIGMADNEIEEILCDGYNDLGIDAVRIDFEKKPLITKLFYSLLAYSSLVWSIFFSLTWE